MGSEQRIIGGGLLLLGVAVVLILLFVFNFGGKSPKEGYEELLGDIYPAYKTAVEKADYHEQMTQAKRVNAVLDEAGKRAVMTFVKSEANSGDKDAQMLVKLVEADAFTQAADGKYGFEGGFYTQGTHEALVAVGKAVDQMKLLRTVRDTAAQASGAINEARLGSGKPLAFPEPKLVPKDDAPIMSPNPVYQNDAALYRVFGIRPADLEAALATPHPGAGRAGSARLRWNQRVPTSDLGKMVGDIEAHAATLERLSVAIRLNALNAAKDETARGPLAALLKRAATYLGSGLSGDHATAFAENRAKFETGVAVATVLDREAKMLLAYKGTYGQLGALFGKSFPK